MAENYNGPSKSKGKNESMSKRVGVSVFLCTLNEEGKPPLIGKMKERASLHARQVSQGREGGPREGGRICSRRAKPRFEISNMERENPNLMLPTLLLCQMGRKPP